MEVIRKMFNKKDTCDYNQKETAEICKTHNEENELNTHRIY